MYHDDELKEAMSRNVGTVEVDHRIERLVILFVWRLSLPSRPDMSFTPEPDRAEAARQEVGRVLL